MSSSFWVLVLIILIVILGITIWAGCKFGWGDDSADLPF